MNCCGAVQVLARVDFPNSAPERPENRANRVGVIHRDAPICYVFFLERKRLFQSESEYLYWNLGSVNSMTRMSSVTTIQEAVSSVNWELNLKPGLVSKFTGRFTNSK
jgi:hypothetical protein